MAVRWAKIAGKWNVGSLDHRLLPGHLPVMPTPLMDGAALFLDIDGTLLDIAARPDAVVVPPDLPGLLGRLRERLGGALAIITGRPLAQVDAFFPGDLPAAAEHGAILRDAAGKLHHIAARPASFDHWLKTLNAETRDIPGVIIEVKAVSLVIHYREAPEAAGLLRALAESLIAESGPDVALLPAHMAFELRPRGAGKDSALAWLLERAPFAGRKPVFVGDDTTDEPAIALAIARGGAGLHVARDFGGSAQAVRDWLGAL
jgi:trehalose 6-phosphate phosphatase